MIAIYMYQPGERYPDTAVKSLLGSVARLVYSYYNPVAAGEVDGRFGGT